MQNLFQKMIETYGDSIYRLTLRYCGNAAQAQDLTQETFLRAYKNLSSYDRSKPAGPWLYKIATNLCRNWLRDQRLDIITFDETTSEASDSNPEELYLQKEQDEEITKALHSLPPIYREVLLLRHIGELSYNEMSAVLELELSQVKNRLYRGRVMLREVLERRNRS